MGERWLNRMAKDTGGGDGWRDHPIGAIARLRNRGARLWLMGG